MLRNHNTLERNNIQKERKRETNKHTITEALLRLSCDGLPRCVEKLRASFLSPSTSLLAQAEKFTDTFKLKFEKYYCKNYL